MAVLFICNFLYDFYIDTSYQYIHLYNIVYKLNHETNKKYVILYFILCSSWQCYRPNWWLYVSGNRGVVGGDCYNKVPVPSLPMYSRLGTYDASCPRLYMTSFHRLPSYCYWR